MGILDDLVQKATEVLTPASDTAPVVLKVKNLKGTIYWGGAGLDGGYIQDQMDALYEHGMKYIFEGRGNTGSTIGDALLSGTALRYKHAKDFRVDESKLSNPATQFNLIGYSYGSLIAAQTASDYASKGVYVDNLVLVASPIDGGFLKDLKSSSYIGKVHVVNLVQFNDPLHAGMSQAEMIAAVPTLHKQDSQSGTTKGIGHFYYRPSTPEGATRRRTLARFLQLSGLK